MLLLLFEWGIPCFSSTHAITYVYTLCSVLLAVAHWSYTKPQAHVAEDQLCESHDTDCSQSLPSSLNGDGAPLASCRVGCKSMSFSNHAKKP